LKYRFFILFLFFVFNVKAQEDSIPKRIVQEIEFLEDYSQELQFHEVDTIINRFYNFDEDGIDGAVSIGNPGGAKGYFVPKINKYGFNFGETLFDAQFSDVTKNVVYRSNIPFARIAYLGGPKKYQNFNLLFTENLNPRMNIAVRLETYGSDGFYLNQESSNKLFSIQNTYKSRKNKYGYFVKFTSQSGSIHENGGIKGDSIYLNNLTKDKLNVEVWFEQLSTNRYDKRTLDIQQFYRFGDVDSLHSKNDGFFVLMENRGFFQDFWYENQRPDSVYFSFFNRTLNDSSIVTDRAHLFGLENEFLLKYRSEGGLLDIRFGYGLDIYKPETYVSDTSFISHSLKGVLKNFVLGDFVINAQLEKGIAGYNSDGHQFDISVLKSFFDNRLGISGYVSSIKTLPDYKYIRYAGNTYSWDNSLGYLDHNTFGLVTSLDSIGLKFSGKMSQTTNYTYFDINAQPQQFSGNYAIYELRLEKKFVLKSYHFDVTAIYQSVEEQAPVNIPTLIWKVSFYYQRYLFKNALELRYGIDYWQNTTYAADYYVPFTRSFIYQNDYKVGNFPYFDFYISARIKSAQGFVKFQNIGQLFLGQSYMMVPYYPMQDFGMAFGLRWDFFN